MKTKFFSSLFCLLATGLLFSTLLSSTPYLKNTFHSNYKVQVTEDVSVTNLADKIIATCVKDSNCYRKELLNQLKINPSTSNSIKLFTSITESSNGMSGGCNSVGRMMGEELFKIHGKDVFTNYSVICGHAYMYGFMIGYGKILPEETKTSFLRDYCKKDVNPVSCVYGVGYAIHFATLDGAEAQKRCITAGENLSNIDPDLIPSYQMTGPGDCILGWASGVMDNMEVKENPKLEDALKICNGMTDGSLRVCLAEASFAYSFQGHPVIKEREQRLAEIKIRCQEDTSYECMQFLGKAIVDHLIYTVKIDLKSDQMTNYAAQTIESLCVGSNAQACLMGSIQDQLTRTTHDDMMKLCSAFTIASNKKFCLDTNLQHE